MLHMCPSWTPKGPTKAPKFRRSPGVTSDEMWWELHSSGTPRFLVLTVYGLSHTSNRILVTHINPLITTHYNMNMIIWVSMNYELKIMFYRWSPHFLFLCHSFLDKSRYHMNHMSYCLGIQQNIPSNTILSAFLRPLTWRSGGSFYRIIP